MKHYLLLTLGAGLFLSACNSDDSNTSTTTDSTTTTETSTTNPGMTDTGMGGMRTDTGMGTGAAPMSSTPLAEADKQMAMKAAQGNMMEIESSNLALQNSTNDRIKAYANMMITDHTKAGDQMKSMAAAKGLTLPDSLDKKGRSHMESMRKMKGAAFDRHYMQMMVDDHVKTVDLFKKGSTGATDADLKNFFSTNLPTIQMHADSAKAISKAKM